LGLDSLDANLGQGVEKLAFDQTDAVGERFDVGGGLGVRGGAFEIVEHGQQLFQKVLTRALFHIGEFSPGALAKVVEISGGAQQLVAELGVFGLGRLQRVDVSGGVGRN